MLKLIFFIEVIIIPIKPIIIPINPIKLIGSLSNIKPKKAAWIGSVLEYEVATEKLLVLNIFSNKNVAIIWLIPPIKQ